MNNFYIVIDTRENKLLQWFGEKINDGKWVPKKKYEKYVKFEQLPCGDICFFDGAGDANSVPVVLIERKEVKDLSGCIYNKSYKEQKLRMLKYQSEHPTVQLVYLIENFSIATSADLKKIVNPGAPPNQKKSRQVLLSAIVSTMLRDNFFTHTTQGFEGTVAFIERIYEKWPDYRSQLAKRTHNGGETEYLKNIKVQKKQNLGPQQWYITALAQIQGVSIDKATSIAKIYPNFKSLLDTYEELKTEKERNNLLKDIETGKAGGRKLGPVCSKRVYQFVCQDSQVSN